MNTIQLCVICVNLLSFPLYGQNISRIDENKYDIKKINRFGFGGVYSNMLIEKNKNQTIPGFLIYNSYLIQSNHNLNYGLGLGFELYEKQLLLPASIDLMPFLNKNLFLDLQAGYSFGWKRKSNYYENYVFHGGFFSSIGTGYKFLIYNEVNPFIEISYNYQKAMLKSGSLPNNAVHIHSFLLTFGLLLELK
jgi:hypothetical protein